MSALLHDLISSNRILVSRSFAFGFFVLLVLTESAEEGRIISSFLFLAGLVLVGIATVGRLWCSLYISGYKTSALITSGPYSLTRNPLYFFSFLGIAGLGLATETFTFAFLFVLLFAIVYPSVISSEEQVLHGKFGEAFVQYCARTPRFFPRLRGYNEPDSWVVNPKLFRRTMGDVLWFIWLVGIIEFVEALHEYEFLTPIIRLP